VFSFYFICMQFFCAPKIWFIRILLVMGLHWHYVMYFSFVSIYWKTKLLHRLMS
jgi:hypothetical protein